MYKIVLLRHGESVWNQANRFTGWTDVDLSDNGVAEALQAGQLLKEHGYAFDTAFTSVLKRANKTLNIVLEALDMLWLPVQHSWRLNERHYGALQGLNKAETTEKFGAEQVLRWRRSYDTPPPALAEDDPRLVLDDPRYARVAPAQMPRTECLKDAIARVVPYWDTVISPEILVGKRILITAHGNSLRALVKHLDQIGDEEIVDLNIPTAQPLVYELDANLKPVRHYFLDDADKILAAQAQVAAQAKA